MLFRSIFILAIYHRERRQDKTMPKWMNYVFIQVLSPYLLLSMRTRRRQREIPAIGHKRKTNRFPKLPRDNTLDAIFSRMLERLLHLEQIEAIFGRFHTAIQHDQVGAQTIGRVNDSNRCRSECARLATFGVRLRSNPADTLHVCLADRNVRHLEIGRAHV